MGRLAVDGDRIILHQPEVLQTYAT